MLEGDDITDIKSQMVTLNGYDSFYEKKLNKALHSIQIYQCVDRSNGCYSSVVTIIRNMAQCVKV